MQAVVQKLCDKPDENYATEIIQSRASYILIRVISKKKLYLKNFFFTLFLIELTKKKRK